MNTIVNYQFLHLLQDQLQTVDYENTSTRNVSRNNSMKDLFANKMNRLSNGFPSIFTHGDDIRQPR